MVTREQIVTEAREWLGTPWRHQRRSKGVAADCAGLVVGVGMRCGAFKEGQIENSNMNQYRAYSHIIDTKQMLKALKDLMVESDDLIIGNVCFLQIDGIPQHLGIISRTSPNLYIIHGYFKIRRVVENKIDNTSHIRGVWRYPMITD